MGWAGCSPEATGYASLNLIDCAKMRDNVKERWFNQTLFHVYDCMVRLGVVQGDFHWHHHDNEDAFFYVISGKLYIDLDDRTVELGPNQGFTVPRQVAACWKSDPNADEMSEQLASFSS